MQKGRRVSYEPQAVPQLLDLSGRSAIVTGGAAGIGQAISVRLAEAGARVIVADIDLAGGQKTVDAIRLGGGKAEAVRADVRSRKDAVEVVKAALDAFGGLDILVNNAAVYPFSLVMKISEETWDRTIDTNLKGLFFYSQAAAEVMIKAGRGGRIVNLASIDALRPTRGTAHYDASKGGVLMLTKAMALELAAHNILVNAIAPGAVATPGNQVMIKLLHTDEVFAKNLLSRIPLGRVAEPDDIAKMVLCLVSGAADYVTGSLVVVDGGYLLD
ncbi:MAG: SDR family NAD(P)-dependent oxidoreductase [Chloroflexi bacterium]|nr:SDR family NAD(P)-dependent oxidoreductase [Chloroflexota bacterium]